MFFPKLIVTDLDGTALKNDKTISDRTIQAFSRCEQMGIPVAIATARYIYGARPYAEALHARYQILTDGTLIYEHEKCIYSNCMDLHTTRALVRLLCEHKLTTHIAIPTEHGLYRYPKDPSVTHDYILFSPEEPFPYPANKMVVEIPTEGIAKEIAEKCGCAQLRYRGEDRYTFFDHSASKLSAIRFLTQKLHITLEDVLVFGDDLNDMEMIAHCGCGVAMKNALPQVQAAANATTLSNEEDGVAVYLNTLLS